jgi:2-aminoadipate transaminase
MSDPKLGALQYGWPEGNEALRTWIATRLSINACRVDASDVIVTAGAQQAIALAVDALAAPGATSHRQPTRQR